MTVNDCAKCGNAKEPSRANSKKCRACDAADRARRGVGQQTAHRRLTLDLPVDVWERLDAEAQDHGQRIAGYLRNLTVTRDAKRQDRLNSDQ